MFQKRVFRIILAVISVLTLVIIVGFVIFYFYFYPSLLQKDTIVRYEDDLSGSLSDIVLSKTGTVIDTDTYNENQDRLLRARLASVDGNYEEAMTMNEYALQSGAEETHTAKQISDARQMSIMKYRITGKSEDSIEAIENLKKNVLDLEIPAKRRARSLNSLATAPHWMARDPRAMQAIYIDEPFRSYWTGDPSTTVRDMLLWSYNKIYPTPKAASTLAYWYVDKALLANRGEDTATDEEVKLFITNAKKYIREGAELAKRESLNNEYYTLKQRYVGHLYRRAFAIGGLAVLGEVSVEEYEQAYEAFFVASEKSGHNSSQYKPFSYVLQAKFDIMLGRDTTKTQEKLLQAIAFVEADPVPQSNEIVDFIGDKARDQTGRFSWHAIQDMRKVSPEFDIFVREIELANQQ